MKSWCLMKTVIVVGVLIVTGCVSHRTYEIDLSQAEGFEWDGRIRVTEAQQPCLGPCLTVETRRYVDRIELMARDGHAAAISMSQSGSPPTAIIGPDPPQQLEVFGTSGIWHGSNVVLVAEPEDIAELRRISASQPAATSQPAEEPIPLMKKLQSPEHEMRPYLEHADELTLADWWAIALGESADVTLEFDVPAENLKIQMRGNPRQYGPAQLQVRTSDGRLIRQFERQQIPVDELEPEAAGDAEGEAP